MKTGVDTTDIAEVAKTLGHNVEVFDPFASSPPRTLFSGGGRSKRTAQLLKVKRGVFKPMKAGAILDELPPDIMRDVVGRLDPKDNSSLINVSRGVREDTLAAMPAQERLWHATKLLNIDHVEAALKEGARVNKIDPSSGMNAPKMASILLDKDIDRTVAVYDLLLQKGGNPLNMKEINKHLLRCVKAITGLQNYDPDHPDDSDNNSVVMNDSDSDDDTKGYPYEEDNYYYGSPYTMLKEALLDGADANMETKYRVADNSEPGYSELRITKSGGLLHLLTLRADSSTSNWNILNDIQTRVDTINELKSFGIDMNQVDLWSQSVTSHLESATYQTALHYACSPIGLGYVFGIRPAIAKALLECGIDVNKKDSRGYTVLHDLVKESLLDDPDDFDELRQEEDASLARLVLSFGADVSIKDEEYTEEGYDYDPVMIDVLIRATAAREDLIEAVKSGDHLELVKFLEQGAPVNTMVRSSWIEYDDEAGEEIIKESFTTLLHEAILNLDLDRGKTTDNLEIVRLLLAEPGVDVNAVDWRGYTALSMAFGMTGQDLTAQWRVDVVKMLLAKPGIDLNSKARLLLPDINPLNGSLDIYPKSTFHGDNIGNWRASRRHNQCAFIEYDEMADEEIIKLVAQLKGIPYENPYTSESRSRSRMTRSRDESEYESDIDRSVRQRVGGRRGGSLEASNSNIQSNSSRYGKERTNDAALAQAITVLFSQMKMNMKYELLESLKIIVRINSDEVRIGRPKDIQNPTGTL